jgi:formylglycine-generating enzyme required for sulfatase activity
VIVESFRLARYKVTNGEYLRFVEAGGTRRNSETNIGRLTPWRMSTRFRCLERSGLFRTTRPPYALVGARLPSGS